MEAKNGGWLWMRRRTRSSSYYEPALRDSEKDTMASGDKVRHHVLTMIQGKIEEKNIAHGFAQMFPRRRLYHITIMNTGHKSANTHTSLIERSGDVLIGKTHTRYQRDDALVSQ